MSVQKLAWWHCHFTWDTAVLTTVLAPLAIVTVTAGTCTVLSPNLWTVSLLIKLPQLLESTNNRTCLPSIMPCSRKLFFWTVPVMAHWDICIKFSLSLLSPSVSLSPSEWDNCNNSTSSSTTLIGTVALHLWPGWYLSPHLKHSPLALRCAFNDWNCLGGDKCWFWWQ